MPRNGSGTMSVVNSFTASTAAVAAEVNANFTDVAAEITGSLPRDGQAGMTGQMKSASGTVGAPGIAFSSDLDSGFYRIGADNIGVSANGAKVWEWNASGLDIASGKTLTMNGSAVLKASNNLSEVSAKYTAFDTLTVHGADVASAGTIDLDAATGNLIDVTGTTSITAVTLADGRERTVRFTGSLTLTHGASLILPDAASIKTAAGDFAVFRGYAAGVVRCVCYHRLNRHGSDVASASTIDLNLATGSLVDVTGTTSITAITLADGREATVRFTGALTLTHGSSLVLPGAANIVTSAGDFATFRGYASSVVRCSSFTRADGAAIRGGKVLLNTLTASSSASLTDTTSLTSTYSVYDIELEGIVPATNAVTFGLEVSTDGGSSYQTSSYSSGWTAVTGSAGPVDSSSSTNIPLALSNALSNSTSYGLCGTIRVYHPSNTSRRKMFQGGTVYAENTGSILVSARTSGMYTGSSAAVNALRFIMSSGNIASGTIRIYGVSA